MMYFVRCRVRRIQCALCIDASKTTMKRYTLFQRVVIQLAQNATLIQKFSWQTHQSEYRLSNNDTSDSVTVNAGLFRSLETAKWIEPGKRRFFPKEQCTELDWTISASGAMRAAALVEQHERFMRTQKRGANK